MSDTIFDKAVEDYKPVLEATVPGIGKIYRVRAPYDKAVIALTPFTNDLMTGNDGAISRMFLGDQHSLSTNGSHVKEDGLYIPEKYSKTGKARTLLLKDFQIILRDAANAVNAHGKGKEYIVGEVFANMQELVGDTPNSPIIELGKDRIFPTDRFGEALPMLWFYGANKEGKFIAGDYGLWLKDKTRNKIQNSGFYADDEEHINSQDAPYANKLWLHWLGNYSLIIGDNRDLGINKAVRGVCRESAVGGAQNIGNVVDNILSISHGKAIDAGTVLVLPKDVASAELIKYLLPQKRLCT